MVHRLLHMGAIDTINHQDSQGWTALHLVAAYCEPEYVEVCRKWHLKIISGCLFVMANNV